MLPLQGLRILDLSTVVFGPYASQILAEYGADVIKIESPEGDSTRHTGPTTEEGMGAIFLGVNRGKRSVVLDLKTEAGRRDLQRLVDTADALMHSIRPQKLAAIGLDPTVLRARCPRLVFVGLHGFAEAGPYGGQPAYDDIIQGMSGCAALMEAQTGQAQYYPTIAADKTSALVAAHAILAALLHRERTGEGCTVEVPMFESMVAFNLVEHFYGRHFEPPLAPPGYPRLLNPYRRPYRTLDGYVCAMPYTDAHWQRFFAEAGEPALAADARFTNISARTRHVEVLYQHVDRILATRSTADWLATFARLEIPAATMGQLEELPNDTHLRATGFFESVNDPAMGILCFPGNPVHLNGERLPARMAPRLGQHTVEVLAELAAVPAEKPGSGAWPTPQPRRDARPDRA